MYNGSDIENIDTEKVVSPGKIPSESFQQPFPEVEGILSRFRETYQGPIPDYANGMIRLQEQNFSDLVEAYNRGQSSTVPVCGLLTLMKFAYILLFLWLFNNSNEK